MALESIRSSRQVDLSSAASGHGGYGYCPEGIPAETAILAILGAFGAAFGILYRAVTIKTGGRRKRSAEQSPVSGQTVIADLAWSGNERLILSFLHFIASSVQNPDWN